LSTYCIFRENTPGAASSAALRALPCTEEGVLFQHILNTEPFFKIYRTSLWFLSANTQRVLQNNTI
jgi:hypothetical protein